jgi:predicted homoserine dehydrogenase-like protein
MDGRSVRRSRAPRKPDANGPGMNEHCLPSPDLLPSCPNHWGGLDGACSDTEPADGIVTGNQTRSLTRNPQIVGIVGTGFLARGLARAIHRSDDFILGPVLTRRKETSLPEFPDGSLVASIDSFVERSELVIECTGDALHATEAIDRALLAGRPVVTMDAEWHVTAGSFYRSRGLVTEAEGDQPGSLAALAEDCRAMGFEPAVYVSVKKYLDLNPTPDQMTAFATRHGISVPMTTSFTDGSKLHIEQALLANGLGVDMVRPKMLGPVTSRMEDGLKILAMAAEAQGGAIADYVLTPEAPGAVLILARHSPQEAASLSHLKMGDGPFYRMVRPYHLCHLEVLKTLRRIAAGGGVLLDNGPRPTFGVAAVAKRCLQSGDRIGRGLGSFAVRGECVRIAESVGHLPITLMQDVVVRRAIEPGERILRQDVDMPDSRALRAWLAVEAACAGNAPSASGRL